MYAAKAAVVVALLLVDVIINGTADHADGGAASVVVPLALLGYVEHRGDTASLGEPERCGGAQTERPPPPPPSRYWTAPTHSRISRPPPPTVTTTLRTPSRAAACKSSFKSSCFSP